MNFVRSRRRPMAPRDNAAPADAGRRPFHGGTKEVGAPGGPGELEAVEIN